MSNTKTCLGFAFYTWGKIENPKRFKIKLGLSWNSAENAF